jgi:hypothetical protein
MIQVSPSTQDTGKTKRGASAANILPQPSKYAAHVSAKNLFIKSTVA